jgi:hypothetical protein
MLRFQCKMAVDYTLSPAQLLIRTIRSSRCPISLYDVAQLVRLLGLKVVQLPNEVPSVNMLVYFYGKLHQIDPKASRTTRGLSPTLIGGKWDLNVYVDEFDIGYPCD